MATLDSYESEEESDLGIPLATRLQRTEPHEIPDVTNSQWPWSPTQTISDDPPVDKKDNSPPPVDSPVFDRMDSNPIASSSDADSISNSLQATSTSSPPAGQQQDDSMASPPASQLRRDRPFIIRPPPPPSTNYREPNLFDSDEEEDEPEKLHFRHKKTTGVVPKKGEWIRTSVPSSLLARQSVSTKPSALAAPSSDSPLRPLGRSVAATQDATAVASSSSSVQRISPLRPIGPSVAAASRPSGTGWIRPKQSDSIEELPVPSNMDSRKKVKTDDSDDELMDLDLSIAARPDQLIDRVIPRQFEPPGPLKETLQYLNFKQKSREWLAARTEQSASSIFQICGLGLYFFDENPGTPQNFLATALGRLRSKDLSQNVNILFGERWEDRVRTITAKVLGVHVHERELYVSKKYRFMSVSPDGLADGCGLIMADGGGKMLLGSPMVEIKCSRTKLHQNPQVSHIFQLQYQMFMCQREFGLLVAYTNDENPAERPAAKYDAAGNIIMAPMIEQCRIFLMRRSEPFIRWMMLRCMLMHLYIEKAKQMIALNNVAKAAAERINVPYTERHVPTISRDSFYFNSNRARSDALGQAWFGYTTGPLSSRRGTDGGSAPHVMANETHRRTAWEFELATIGITEDQFNAIYPEWKSNGADDVIHNQYPPKPEMSCIYEATAPMQWMAEGDIRLPQNNDIRFLPTNLWPRIDIAMKMRKETGQPANARLESARVPYKYVHEIIPVREYNVLPDTHEYEFNSPEEKIRFADNINRLVVAANR